VAENISIAGLWGRCRFLSHLALLIEHFLVEGIDNRCPHDAGSAKDEQERNPVEPPYATAWFW
jgi:hypothetical protein